MDGNGEEDVHGSCRAHAIEGLDANVYEGDSATDSPGDHSDPVDVHELGILILGIFPRISHKEVSDKDGAHWRNKDIQEIQVGHEVIVEPDGQHGAQQPIGKAMI